MPFKIKVNLFLQMWMFINNTLLGNKVVEQCMYLKNIFVYVLVYRKILEE